MKKICNLSFPSKWINGIEFDSVMAGSKISPYSKTVKEVVFLFPTDSKILIDAAVQILSIANQLVRERKKVKLIFEDNDAMGYLNRIRFFEELNKKIKVEPKRPSDLVPEIYSGTSSRLVEIHPINPKRKDLTLPGLLAQRVAEAESGKVNKAQLRATAFTVFGELIDNIFQHSATKISGYAAFQIYSNKNSAMVAVSDSGHGILKTIRPFLKTKRLSKYRNLSDPRLIVEMFKTGISRKGEERGCGLKACADQAIKFKADLRVRLHKCSVYLKLSGEEYTTNSVHCFENRPLIKGTHISFTFHLD